MTQNLLAGRVKFKNAAKKAGVSIDTKINRDYRGVEVVSVRNSDFETIFWAHETKRIQTDGDVAPVWFRIAGLTDYLTIKLIKDGFISRMAVEKGWSDSEQIVTYWAKPIN